MYYMINYITKYDINQYQLIIIIIFMKHVWEKIEKITNFFKRNLKFQCQKMKKFALWVFNYLLIDCEISNFQAVSCFFNLLNYYTFFTTFQNLNLWHLWNWFKSIIQAKLEMFEEEKKSVIITRARKASQIMFDYYYWHDSFFLSFSLYKYFKLIIIKLKIKITSRDIWFFFKHFDYKKKFRAILKNNLSINILWFY